MPQLDYQSIADRAEEIFMALMAERECVPALPLPMVVMPWRWCQK